MADLEAVRRVLTLAPEEWLQATLESMPRYGIDTPLEAASYLATVGWESRQFSRLTEYLNYSAERLVAVWGQRFYLGAPIAGKRNAAEFANQPYKLAEFVYGGRLGNGPEGSGDGWKYRGRGPGQLTGSTNYRRAQDATGLVVWDTPDLMLIPEVGSEITCWFWRDGGFDKIDDDADIRAETKRWQGGAEGLFGRQKLMNSLILALGA